MSPGTNTSSDEELFGFLANGLAEERVAKIIRVLPDWISTSLQFKGLIKTYKDKVHSKLKNADSPEAFDDMFYEIFIAFQLLSNFGNMINSMAYEKYGDKSGPDFTISLVGGFFFNVEVKRVREYQIELAFSSLVSFIGNELRRSLIGIAIDLSLNKFDKNDLLFSAKLQDYQFQQEALNFIKACLADFESGDRNSQKTYTYCGFISIGIQKCNYNGLCLNSFTTAPIPYYDDAKDKIAERIRDALRQVIKNESNLIVVGTLNICYDESNFFEAMKALPNEFGADSKFQFVSAILYKGWGDNQYFIWFTENATIPLPANFRQQLESFAHKARTG